MHYQFLNLHIFSRQHRVKKLLSNQFLDMFSKTIEFLNAHTVEDQIQK
jgi:hypothetical protein